MSINREHKGCECHCGDEALAGQTDDQVLVAEDEDETSASVFAVPAIFFVVLYQKLLSPLLPPSCRYRPTCSQYTLIALRRYGLVRGGWLGLKRILRCHPFRPGGYDPVP